MFCLFVFVFVSTRLRPQFLSPSSGSRYCDVYIHIHIHIYIHFIYSYDAKTTCRMNAPKTFEGEVQDVHIDDKVHSNHLVGSGMVYPVLVFLVFFVACWGNVMIWRDCQTLWGKRWQPNRSARSPDLLSLLCWMCFLQVMVMWQLAVMAKFLLSILCQGWQPRDGRRFTNISQALRLIKHCSNASPCFSTLRMVLWLLFNCTRCKKGAQVLHVLDLDKMLQIVFAF